MPVAGAQPITFADVGGLEGLKERLRMDIVYPLQKPELFRAYGKRAGGGVLLFGPPGCGKTHLARAAAGECGARMIVVEIQQVLEMWLGESEKRLHQLFERARAEAPTILFFDEVEAIGAARHQLRHGPGRRRQPALGRDGRDRQRQRARPDHRRDQRALGRGPGVEAAGALRPGRVRAAARPPGARGDLAPRVPRAADQALDCAAVARRTARWSGADLVHLAEVASERALQQALRSGSVTPITQSDLVASLDRVKPTTSEWLEAARRYVTYANQAGQYDEVAAYLRGRGSEAGVVLRAQRVPRAGPGRSDADASRAPRPCRLGTGCTRQSACRPKLHRPSMLPPLAQAWSGRCRPRAISGHRWGWRGRDRFPANS